MWQSGCAHYHALPLPTQPVLASRVGDLTYPGGLRPGPLTVKNIGILAIENNPTLKAARAQHDVAQAQSLQAGLAPNPQVTGAILPLAAGVGSTLAWNAGLNYDVKSLITLSRRRESAKDAALQVDAQLLWQEWQVIGQARLLAVDLIEAGQGLALLKKADDLFQERAMRSKRAMQQGDTTLSMAAPDIAAASASRTQKTAEERQIAGLRHQLNTLLGLPPDADVPLAETADLPPLDLDAVQHGLIDLPSRRPDLIALQLGYRAEDSRLRAAILAQFPNLTFGVTGSSDNSNVRNVGPQIGVDLPIFDRNQGNVAIEQATRQQLHDEYTARLATITSQTRAGADEIALLKQHIAAAQAELPALECAADNATRAMRSGSLDERSAVDLIAAKTSKEQDIVTLEQSLLEREVALATETGTGMPLWVQPTVETIP